MVKIKNHRKEEVLLHVKLKLQSTLIDSRYWRYMHDFIVHWLIDDRSIGNCNFTSCQIYYGSAVLSPVLFVRFSGLKQKKGVRISSADDALDYMTVRRLLSSIRFESRTRTVLQNLLPSDSEGVFDLILENFRLTQF